MRKLAVLLVVSITIPAIASARDQGQPISAETIQVLKIAAQDERAVIRTPDGTTQIIKPGDPLGTNGKVTEIAADRVVIEEKQEQGTEKVIIRLVDGKQKIERVRKTAGQAPTMLAPPERDKNAGKQKSGFQ